jgi:hypothetical protein
MIYDWPQHREREDEEADPRDHIDHAEPRSIEVGAECSREKTQDQPPRGGTQEHPSDEGKRAAGFRRDAEPGEHREKGKDGRGIGQSQQEYRPKRGQQTGIVCCAGGEAGDGGAERLDPEPEQKSPPPSWSQN